MKLKLKKSLIFYRFGNRRFQKRAQAGMPVNLTIVVVIALIVLFVVYFGLIKPGGKIATGITAMGPSVDELCVARSKLVTGERVDIDGDGRQDYLCDSCVCSSGCNNKLKENGGDDSDGDHLPDKCDSVDNDKTKYEFDKTVCPENSLINLGGAYKKQCRPK